MVTALSHFTAIRDSLADRPPSRWLAECLSGRSLALSTLGRIAEAADEGRRALTVAREIGYPAGQALALLVLSGAALATGDVDGSVRLARQAQEIPADISGMVARRCSSMLTDALIESGDLVAA